MKLRYTISIILVAFIALPAMSQCKFAISIAGRDVRCFDESNGEAKVTITPVGQNSAPYVIQWFDGFNQDFRNDLPAGTHFVKVTDSFGCFAFEFITINQPDLLVTSAIVEPVRCYGEPQGTIDLTVEGGTLPYNYQWSNGETTADMNTLLAGTYSLTVHDANNCVTTRSDEIIQPEDLRVSPAVTPVSCFGGDDGKIKATIFGGVQPYRYAWDTPDTIPDIANLVAGNHTLTVTDANLCIHNEVIFVPQPQQLEVDFLVKKVSCFDLPDGEVTATVTGGTFPYSYEWSNSSFVLGDTTNHPMNLFRDYYTLKVTDIFDCILIDSVLVEEPNPLVINLEATDATCYAKPNGEIDLSISGGTTPYEVLWSNTQRTQDLAGLLADSYSVVVVDVLGCTRYGEIEVGQPDSLSFQVVIDEVSCKDQRDGVITIDPKGGTPGYDVLWSNNRSEFFIDQLDGGIYSVTLTDAQECVYNRTFTLPVNGDFCITYATVPNAFTPNGDEYNDRWVIKNYEVYPDMEVSVFNKWGTEIFKSKGYLEPWDGQYNGHVVQTGIYYYTISLNNGDTPFSGTLTIVR